MAAANQQLAAKNRWNCIMKSKRKEKELTIGKGGEGWGRGGK